MNILIVDDESAVAVTLTELLKLGGHVVDVAYDGAAAMSKVTDVPDKFHLIITDHNMPVMNGLELVKKLRETDFKGKIMVMSGWLTHELVKAYEWLMVDHIVTKPFEVVELRNAVKALGEK